VVSNIYALSFRTDEIFGLYFVIFHAFEPYFLISYQSKAMIIRFVWRFIDNGVDCTAPRYHFSYESHNTMSQWSLRFLLVI
jgi:hypothetical protein